MSGRPIPNLAERRAECQERFERARKELFEADRELKLLFFPELQELLDLGEFHKAWNLSYEIPGDSVQRVLAWDMIRQAQNKKAQPQ